ncbi:hypothetical protein WM2015_1347 [Wenzhouxiangella marina]|uniref:DUF3592 domain-containing protein n=2 Tax=Wenzhouxiangella marina TaxID=1579979 RepID=A0A0K0XVJ7_9GAMM|nr:hypothetical protein WM2015_1347 [Wenzhouxiangella marina]
MGLWLLSDRLVLVQQGLASRSWPQVSGQVEALELVPLRSGRLRPNWRIEISYRYRAAGRDYRGERIRIDDAGRRLNAEQRALAEQRYAAGQAVTVFHAPAEPDRALLEPGVGRRAWLGLGLALAMLAISALFWFVPTRIENSDPSTATGD